MNYQVKFLVEGNKLNALDALLTTNQTNETMLLSRRMKRTVVVRILSDSQVCEIRVDLYVFDDFKKSNVSKNPEVCADGMGMRMKRITFCLTSLTPNINIDKISLKSIITRDTSK